MSKIPARKDLKITRQVKIIEKNSKKLLHFTEFYVLLYIMYFMINLSTPKAKI